MKARIINNEFAGSFTYDFFLNYSNEIINGELVSNWQTSDILPNENFKKPIWNGTQWIESYVNNITVPQSISLLKLRMQLIISGIDLNNVQMVIDGITDPLQKALTNERWKNAVSFDRNNLMLNQLATILGLTQIEINNIFIEGNLLE